MDILLKGLTKSQAKCLVDYFTHSLHNDSSVWLEEHSEDIKAVEVNTYHVKQDLIEVDLITFEK